MVLGPKSWRVTQVSSSKISVLLVEVTARQIDRTLVGVDGDQNAGHVDVDACGR